MVAFVACPAVPSSTAWSRGTNLTVRCHPNPTFVPTKRITASAADRSTEFNLTSSHPPSSPAIPPTPTGPARLDELTPHTLPALPFPPAEVFLPGETKQLHLFEARYLSLFETTLSTHNSTCAHILIDPNRRAMAAVATQLFIREWRQLAVGVSVVVDAVGRVKTGALHARRGPFVTADFVKVVDDIAIGMRGADQLRVLDARFWKAFDNVVRSSADLEVEALRQKVNFAQATIDAMQRAIDRKRQARRAKEEDLETGMDDDEDAIDYTALYNSRNDTNDNTADKLPTSPTQQPPTTPATLKFDNNASGDISQDLERHLKDAASRAVGYAPIDWRRDAADIADDAMVVRRATGLSFAGWEFFPSDAQSRQRAIEERSTLARLEIVVEALELRARELAAKRSIKTAFVK